MSKTNYISLETGYYRKYVIDNLYLTQCPEPFKWLKVPEENKLTVISKIINNNLSDYIFEQNDKRSYEKFKNLVNNKENICYFFYCINSNIFTNYKKVDSFIDSIHCFIASMLNRCKYNLIIYIINDTNDEIQYSKDIYKMLSFSQISITECKIVTTIERRKLTTIEKRKLKNEEGNNGDIIEEDIIENKYNYDNGTSMGARDGASVGNGACTCAGDGTCICDSIGTGICACSGAGACICTSICNCACSGTSMGTIDDVYRPRVSFFKRRRPSKINIK
jgi:hypothetical protein